MDRESDIWAIGLKAQAAYPGVRCSGRWVWGGAGTSQSFRQRRRNHQIAICERPTRTDDHARISAERLDDTATNAPAPA